MGSLITGFIGLLGGLPGMLKDLFGYLNKKADVGLEMFRTGNNNAANVSTAIVQGENSRVTAMCQITATAMSHPVYWVAWSLGVFPVLLYHACIFFVSTFPMYGWTILKVPPDQVEFGVMVAKWMFGIAGTSTVIGALANAWSRRA